MIQQTNDYEIFKKMDGNRKLLENHICDLMISFKKSNLLPSNPIIVNRKMEVLDGQHRLEAAKRLHIPIYYAIAEEGNIEDVARLNSLQRNWKMETFLQIFSNQEHYPQYIKLRDWLRVNKFRLSQGLAFFLDEGSVAEFKKKFKNGEFVFDQSKAAVSEDYKILISKIISHKNGITRPWVQQGFIRAFIVFINNEDVTLDRLWTQVDKYAFIINPMPTKQLYLEMFYNVYNYRKTHRVEI
jgi:hypothetical protein